VKPYKFRVIEREERDVRVAWVSAQIGRFQENDTQLYITLQKASELKNNSHLFYIIIRSFRVSSSHCFLHLSCSFLPGLISFGDLAWSLEGKMALVRM
jgi:hypothetical protein